ncbi:hypothetical protein [Dongshaea marina]|uniref:hypothetical protein n=1 Tax=Dongshaea marina TaxID=2047966 RepID=UPI00131EE8DD|nr:hypothetical protein [Dongshaea marina]
MSGKHPLYLIIAVAFTLSLSACGGGGSSDSGTTNNTNVTGLESPAAVEVVSET